MSRTAVFHLKGLSPYSASRPLQPEPISDKETPDQIDKRVWRDKAYSDPDTGDVYIPGIQFKFAIAEAAKRMSIKIPGKRQQTYTKNVLSGVMCNEPVYLGLKKDALVPEDVYCHVTGKRGPGARVFRRFPMVPKGWQSQLEVTVIDDEIPSDVIDRCVREVGSLLGVGRFRPASGGFLGRFEVTKVEWK